MLDRITGETLDALVSDQRIARALEIQARRIQVEPLPIRYEPIVDSEAHHLDRALESQVRQTVRRCGIE